MRHKVASEFLGTFFLISACTSAVVVDKLTHSLTSASTALLGGLVIMTLIYTVCRISGAHFNPVVSLSFWFVRAWTSHQVICWTCHR